jgi:fluoride exporter
VDMSLITAVAAIAAGATAGALTRWGLAVALNGLFPALPPGTLPVNVAGGYLMGLALGAFAAHPTLPPEWRLLLVTGFLGSLTTFSAFSAEIVHLLQQGRTAWAVAAVSAHVIGAVAATFAGLFSWQWLASRAG